MTTDLLIVVLSALGGAAFIVLMLNGIAGLFRLYRTWRSDSYKLVIYQERDFSAGNNIQNETIGELDLNAPALSSQDTEAVAQIASLQRDERGTYATNVGARLNL